MPIPPLTQNGLLPPGVCGCTLGEIRLRFGSFQVSDRRVELFNSLEQFVTELRHSGRFAAVVVDGSFVTAKPEPGDIDIIAALRMDHDWFADLGARDYALVSRSALRRRYRFDVLLATDGGKEYERYVEFFGRVRDDVAVRKGILRIEL